MAIQDMEKFRILNVRYVAEKSGVDYNKIRHNIMGRYDSLDANEKTMIANAIFADVDKALSFLGFKMQIKRIK